MMEMTGDQPCRQDVGEAAQVEHCLKVLAQALQARDAGTWTHSDRVGTLVLALGRDCSLSAAELECLHLSALLHDIGKIGVPDQVLHNPGRPQGEDWARMQAHPVIGERILQASGLDSLAGIGSVVRHHHEAFNGSGYPDGLRGEAIPPLARMVHLADAYEALSALRPYHPPRGHRAIMDILEAESGVKSDPWMLARFQAVIERSPLRAG